MKVAKKILKNGLEVLLIENHKSPVVSAQIWVQTGSADESLGQEGISHFIEHLVFKGSRKFGVGEIASTVEGSGGELNAYTSFDETVFHITISKTFAKQSLEVLSEMMGYPRFDPTEIDNEREVVIEEIKRGMDSPGRRASQLLFSNNFPRHPYSVPVIGFDKVIRKVSSKKILEYYRGRYSTKNMFLLLVGDFKVNEILPDVTKYFGEIPKTPVMPSARKKFKGKGSPKSVKIEKTSFREMRFHLSWPVPNQRHKDVPGLDVLAMILGQGDSSRLVRRLRLLNPVVQSVGSSSFTLNDGGLFVVSANLQPDNLEQTLVGIGEELEEILAQPVTQEELARAIVNFESEQYYSLETVDGLARRVGGSRLAFGDEKHYEKYLKAVRGLKPEDLQTLARKYLNWSKATLVGLSSGSPGVEQKKIATWLKQQQKKKLPSKKKVTQKSKSKFRFGEGSYHTDSNNKLIMHRLENGLRVVFRPSSETQVVVGKIAFLGGQRFEPTEKSGLTEVLSRTWATATEKQSEESLYREIESMAASISGFGGRHTVGMSMAGLRFFEPMLRDLFFEVLLKPKFQNEIVSREIKVLLEQLKNKQDNPAQVASNLFAEAMYGSHPYGRDILGGPDTLEKLTEVDVQKHLQGFLNPSKAVLMVAGACDVDDWMSAIKALPWPKSKNAPDFLKQMQWTPPSEKRIFSELKKEQTHLLVGYPGLSMFDNRRHALQVLQAILAGQGGRLFVELRDKASLAYSVSPIRMEGIDKGYFGAYIACSPEKAKQALGAIQTEFKRLASDGVGELELERAKRFCVGRHDIDLQHTSNIASGVLFNEIYGLKGDEVFEFEKKIAPVTAKQVQELIKDLISAPPVMVAVGPQSPW